MNLGKEHFIYRKYHDQMNRGGKLEDKEYFFLAIIAVFLHGGGIDIGQVALHHYGDCLTYCRGLTSLVSPTKYQICPQSLHRPQMLPNISNFPARRQ